MVSAPNACRSDSLPELHAMSFSAGQPISPTPANGVGVLGDCAGAGRLAAQHVPGVMISANFEFLRATRPELADLGGFAEHYCFTDAAGTLIKLRLFAEQLVKAVFSHHGLAMQYEDSFNDLLNDPTFRSITPVVVQDKLHRIRIKGNKAAHGNLFALQTAEVIEFIREAHSLGAWYAIAVEGQKRDSLPAWKVLTPETVGSAPALQKLNKAAQLKLAEQEALMAKLLADLEEARAKAEAAEKSPEETKVLLTAAQQAASALDFSEEETRLKLIDDQLIAAGWKVGIRGQSTDEVGQEVPVLHQPTASGTGYVDYVLYSPGNGKPLAIVEAKKTAADAEQGRTQARIYADGMEKQHGTRPVIFYTNGYEIFIWDDAKGEPPRRIAGFYSRDSLDYCIFQRSRQPSLAALSPKRSITDRFYQVEANKRVMERFDQRKRRALIIQATGTGKTRVAIALCELMIRAGWAKRILFLCDRRELRRQADDAFEEHLPGEPRVVVRRNTSGDRNARIYLATYPAMMGCFADFDCGFFDLIIADESHRSIYNRYRDLFRHFDAYQVGLTATPLKFVFRNTYRLFDCENEDPTAHYSYEEAIQHEPPYLCPFKVVRHTTKFLRDGIKYKDLTPEQREQLEDQVEDAASVSFRGEDMSRSVFNEDTELKILRNLMENGLRNADGTRPGKTIIFARNHEHAKLLVKLFEREYPQYGGDFCARIDNYEPRAEQLISDFKCTDGSKNLTIAVSVDMLDTGIDVPAIVNLVFAKPVKSYAKFWQMIGRGTRLCPDLFGPGQDKQFFLIFDHWRNFEYFDELKKEEEPSKPVSVTEQLFEARIQLAEAAVLTQEPEALHLATRLIAEDIAALPERCLEVREKWRAVHSMRKPGVLEGFQASTIASLRRDILPLMRWRDIRGHEAATSHDLLMARLQVETLKKSAKAMNFRDQLAQQTAELPITIKQVAEKLPKVKSAQNHAFLEAATVTDLESMRTELRGLMRFRRKTASVPSGPLTLNIREGEDGIEVSTYTPRLVGLDLAAYRNRVESVLTALLEANPALQKIRSRQPVSDEDLHSLADEVLIHDPGLRLDDLLTHFPNKSRDLALAIRQVIGLDAQKVTAHFQSFLQKYPDLTANQIRFLDLLQSQIARFGVVELDQLWDAPFTVLHTAGVDGVFTESQQIDDLLALLNDINQVAA